MTAAGPAFARLAAARLLSRRALVVVDVVVAALLTVGGTAAVSHLTYSAPTALGWAAGAGCTASVALRRFAPFTVAVFAVTALVVYQSVTNDPDGSFVAPAVILVCYFVGRSAAERSAWTRLMAFLGYALAGNIVIAAATGPFSLLAALGAWPIVLVPVAGGVIVARHASLLHRLAATTGELREEQQVHADRLVGEERNRIARELHDVVAHHVSVMVIQAGAARLVAVADPGAADTALRVVERSGREALIDLRRIMGVLRRGDTPYSTAAAGLAHVDQIVDHARASGVPVEVRVSGRLDQVPAAVDLVAYRVVQEALTNVVKHARPAHALVAIDVRAHVIDVTISDDGAQDQVSVLPGSGHGLIGMHERVSLYGGALRSGPRPQGGFEVHASMPLRHEPLPRPELRGATEAADVRPAERAVRRWRSALSSWSDQLLAVAWLFALEGDALLDHYRRGPLALNLIAVAVMALAFAWRRRAPLLFALVVGSAAIPLSAGLTSAHSTLVGFFCVTVPMFTVAAWEHRPRALLGLTLWIAGSVGTGVVAHKPAAGVAGGLIMSSLVWAAGRLWRRQRLLADRLADAQLLLAAERDDRERLAVAGERARIARELHTLVAHGVVVMIVQAASARETLRADANADRALTSILSVEATGRAALARMREILGVLRAPHTSLPVQPQPGLGQLHSMIARLRERGRAIDLRIDGGPESLPVGVGLTTYRIIEAALADADPHPSRSVVVALRFGEREVGVDITGDGLRLSSQLRLTIAERAALCNGVVLPPTPASGAISQLRVRLPHSVPEVVAV